MKILGVMLGELGLFRIDKLACGPMRWVVVNQVVIQISNGPCSLRVFEEQSQGKDPKPGKQRIEKLGNHTCCVTDCFALLGTLQRPCFRVALLKN